MRVQIRLLGQFSVSVDGRDVPASDWARRSAGALVKLLALSPKARLHRDHVLDTLWPDVAPATALPRLHKAAHFARRALGHAEAVVLRDDVVALFPGAEIVVDTARFEAAAAAALGAEPVSAAACSAAIALSGGDLLPDDLGEDWLDEPRERLRLRTLELLRGARRWQELLRRDPADEQAHVELLREAVTAGDRPGALRRYAEMERLLRLELGVSPGPEAVALRERLLAGQEPAASIPPERSGATDSSLPPRVSGLVEREPQLQLLDDAVRDVIAGGRGVVVLISGEAGAGKSAVVAECVRRVGAGVRTLVGGCDDLFAPRTLGPLKDMAQDFPEIAAALSEDHLDEGLPRLLRFLAGQPTVLVIEDVHWADDSTLDVIRYLGRRIPGIPAVLVLTFRDLGHLTDHPLRQVLGTLAGSSVRHLELPPLSVDAVHRLGVLSEREAEEIHRVTQGNPFFVSEVIAAKGPGVPATVRDAVLARVGATPPQVRALLARLSVIPTRVERWLAEALAQGEPELLVVAEQSGIITGGASTVSFRHELARRAIESALTASQRLRVNDEVVDALLDHPVHDPARLVHHAERSGRVDVLRDQGPTAAAEAARLGAHRQAAEVLRVVLEQVPGLTPAEAAGLWTRRAYSLYVVNQYEAALVCAASAVTAAEDANDPSQVGDALLVLARVAFFARGAQPARDAAERAVETLETVDDPARLASALTELARAHSNLANVSLVAEPVGQAERFAERAALIGQQLDRSDIVAQALCYLGDAKLANGRLEGADDLDRAIALAGSDSRVETRVRCYVNAAGGAFRTGRLGEAERYATEGLRLAADGEFFAGQYRLRLTLAGVDACRGDWDRAIAELRSLLASSGEPGIMAPLAAGLLSRLLARRGEPEAQEVLDRALCVPHLCDDPRVAGRLAVASVELGWLDGSLGDLTEDVRRALDRAAAAGTVGVHAELAAYLRRAGIDVAGPERPPGPWAPTLAGDSAPAAAAWTALGETYEASVVLARSDDSKSRRTGLSGLERLGAVATLAAV